MPAPVLEHFLAQAVARSRTVSDPANCVLAITPLMLDLLRVAHTLLEPQHFRSDPAHYARNPVHDALDASLSLYCLVWLPEQWTPVHDHGSWHR